MLYGYRVVNIFLNGTHVRSRVNLIHFKGVQLGPYETCIMKLTCCTWDCLLEHGAHSRHITQNRDIFIPPPNEVGGGGILDSPCPSVCPSVRLSVRPSVCRRHGFRSISQVCFGISISNFICMLMVAIGRSLLIFSVVTFKMAAWRPYWIFWFPDSNFSLALNIKFKLQGHNTYVYG